MQRADGHVFVVHGRMESVLHDGALVPTDDEGTLESYWQPLVGTNPLPVERLRAVGWARLADTATWMVSVADPRALSLEEILTRGCQALRSVAEALSATRPVGGRGLPRIAVPFLGLGGTGYGSSSGNVIVRLLDWASDQADQLGIDIVLVNPSPSVYAAAQYERGRRLEGRSRSEAADLGRLIRDKRVALFFGAGVGIPAGLPSWDQLLARLGADIDESGSLGATDRAELIEQSYGSAFKSRVAGIISSAHTPSLVHALLASLDIREAVTTNYDRLYEGALAAAGREAKTVFPWDTNPSDGSWILKLHGDIEHEDSIVLTRRHMVKYDAANRPSGSVLQSLLLTKHVLMIGLSLTDDNVIRLAHEVQAYRQEHRHGSEAPTPFGTLLDVSADSTRAKLWKNQIEWVAMGGADLGSRARELELFLDELAIHACATSSWLLDERFAGLFSNDEDRSIADDIRSLYARLGDEGWRDLRLALERMGAGAPKG